MNNRIKRNITIPDYILEIIKLFKDKNQEIYLVGGSVRDSILGIESSDYDLCTSMSTNEIKLLFNEYNIKYICNSRSILDGKKELDKIYNVSLKLEGNKLTFLDILSNNLIKNNEYEHVENKELIDNINFFINNNLKDKEKSVLYYRLNGETQQKISEKLECSRSYISKIEGTVYKKIRNYLKKNNTPCVLYTANEREYINIIDNNLNLSNYFNLMYTTAEIGFKKDEREGFELIARSFGKNIEDIVLFEDSYYAIHTASILNMKSVAVADEFAENRVDDVKNECDIFISSYRQLL